MEEERKEIISMRPTNKKYYQFNLSNKFSNIMPNDLYNLLTNSANQTITKEYQIQKYINENQNFLQDFHNLSMSFSALWKKGLHLIHAPQGSGKTSFIMNFVFTPRPYTSNIPDWLPPTIIVEPKKSNIAQLAEKYPDIAVLTGDTQIVDGVQQYPVNITTPIVVCTPELAAKARKLLNQLFGYVEYLILDEAHDLLTSIPTYRNADQFFDMLKETLLDTTQTFCITATPEPLSFMHFDTIFKFSAVQKLGANLCEIVNIENKDIKHISMASCYVAALKEQLSLNYAPMLVLVENKTLIKKMMQQMKEENYHCLSIYSGNCQDNLIMDSIVQKEMLPAFDETGHPVDVIFATSTIISGITIKPNPELGNRQYITTAIIEDMYKTDLAGLSQFFCRLRYQSAKTVILKRKAKEAPKKMLTLDQCQKIIQSYAGMLSNHSMFAESSFTGYNEETVFNLNAIYDCDKRDFDYFAIFCNSLSERDARLYNHDQEFLAELLHTYTFPQYNIVGRTYETRMQVGLASDTEIKTTKECKEEKKKEKKEYIEKVLNTEVVEKVFSKEKGKMIQEDVREFTSVLRKEMSVLQIAYQFGGAQKVNEVMKSMADNNATQKTLKKTEFEMYRDAAISHPTQQLHITYLELCKYDMDYVRARLRGMFYDKATIEQIVENIKFVKTNIYSRFISNFDFTTGIADLISILQNSKTETEFLRNLRTYSAVRIVHAYQTGTSEQVLNKDSVMGQELNCLLKAITDKNRRLIIKPNTIYANTDFQQLAQYLQENVVLYAAFNKKTVTVKQIKTMFSDILHGYWNKDGSFVIGNGFRKLKFK